MLKLTMKAGRKEKTEGNGREGTIQEKKLRKGGRRERKERKEAG